MSQNTHRRVLIKLFEIICTVNLLADFKKQCVFSLWFSVIRVLFCVHFQLSMLHVLISACAFGLFSFICAV